MKRRVRQQAQFSALYIAAALAVLILMQWVLTPRIDEFPMSRLVELVREDKVARVSFGEREIRGLLKKDALPPGQPRVPDWLERLTGATPALQFYVVRLPGVEETALIGELQAHKVEFSGRIESTFLRDFVLGWLLPIGAMVAIWLFLMRRMGGGPAQALTFGRSRAKIYDRKELKVTFQDVAGVDEAREELAEVVDFLRDPKKYQRLGGRIPKGVLLVGPPGTRQDAARPGGGRRGGRPVLLPVGLGVRGDVRGRRRLPGARPVRAGQGEGALHRLHRRAGRDRQDAGGRAAAWSAATTSASRR